jgi:predicted O-methyltransferase YrrM
VRAKGKGEVSEMSREAEARVAKSFEEVWKLTDTIPGSFTELNAQKLYEYAVKVPEHGMVVEVGVDQGRSASLLLTAAEFTHATVVLIDSWESVLIDNWYKVKKLTEEFRVPVVVHRERSVEAADKLLGLEFDLVHIDANHYGESPSMDCAAWLPLLKSGGIACFHDVGCTFPAVDAAVEKYTAGWEDLGVHDCLAIRRKP